MLAALRRLLARPFAESRLRRRVRRAYEREGLTAAKQVLLDMGFPEPVFVPTDDERLRQLSDSKQIIGLEPDIHVLAIIGGIDGRWVIQMLAKGEDEAVRERLKSEGYSPAEVDRAIGYFESEDST
jgi:hypothetical protein